jgi:hypothetical protein
VFRRVFPRQFDNAYRGHWLGIALFAAIVLLKAIQGFNSIVFTHRIMVGADGIPVDRFDPVAASTAVAMFALLGMYLLVVPLQCLVVLVRYRAMIPFMYLLLLVMQLASRMILFVHPIVRSGENGGQPIGVYINLGILTLTFVGFALSLLDRSAVRTRIMPEGSRP